MTTGNIVSNGETIVRRYIWVDEQSNIQSKTKLEEIRFLEELDEASGQKILKPLPLQLCSIDGRVNGQTDADADLILKPVIQLEDFSNYGDEIVLCEVFDIEKTEEKKYELIPHWSNERALLRDTVSKLAESAKPWFSFKQEYKLSTLGNIAKLEFIHKHKQLTANMLSTYDVGSFTTTPQDPVMAADTLILCRFLLSQTKLDGVVSLRDKKLSCAINYSSAEMRGEVSNEKPWRWIQDTVDQLTLAHNKLVSPETGFYGFNIADKLESLEGIGTSGIGARNVDIRIPKLTALAGKGYIQDLRPCSNADPYTLCRCFLEITCPEISNS